ncbi:uncharacterized protein CMU_021750 [Cryptosporidium muris RN66]|uniref:Transmembrane protein n=1 Tax=Cryptosporidium muris (strain RN66) TaxID=441375 RepID=B6AJM0_CRYMR|nr:uncharacterized protein CMU_021750 [Cryptosporidium muris RN66]EEA08411.1 hypothetical protein, conserved [Cryptosporidium muris RN66]|eukprot:XP_002142760.1 hypothetical protein [Cryptosporidium muris RN66]
MFKVRDSWVISTILVFLCWQDVCTLYSGTYKDLVPSSEFNNKRIQDSDNYIKGFEDEKNEKTLFIPPLNAKGIFIHKSPDPATIQYSPRVTKGAIFQEGEILGFLEFQGSIKRRSVTTLLSPCIMSISNIFETSGSIVSALYEGRTITPRNLISFNCIEVHSDTYLIIREVSEHNKSKSKLIDVIMKSSSNIVVISTANMGNLPKGSVLISLWYDQNIYLLFETLQDFYNVRILIDTKVIGVPLIPGIPLINFQYYVETFKEDIKKQYTGMDYLINSDNFSIKSDFNEHKNNLREAKNKRIASVTKNQESVNELLLALANAAWASSIFIRMKKYKGKLYELKQSPRLNEKAIWVIYSPCNGKILLSRTFGKVIPNGSTLAILQCEEIEYHNEDKKSRIVIKRNLDIKTPFSLTITKLHIDFIMYSKETESYIKKGDKILTGNLTGESENISPYIIFGDVKIITSPCQGKLIASASVGEYIGNNNSLVQVECEGGERREEIAETSALVSFVFKDDEAEVKDGEALLVLRPKWKILNSPCDGIIIYIESPGVIQIQTNLATIQCKDQILGIQNIQSNKPLTILAHVLPNPSMVVKNQPLIIVDYTEYQPNEAKQNGELKNKIIKKISPNKEFAIEYSKIPDEINIQNVISPCNGKFLLQKDHVLGNTIKRQKILANVLCKNGNNIVFQPSKDILILKILPLTHSTSGKDSIETKDQEIQVKSQKEKKYTNNSSIDSSFEDLVIDISSGDIIFEILFIHNVKYYITMAPCNGFGYSHNSVGDLISEGQYFAIVQCKTKENKKKSTQKFKSKKDVYIASKYLEYKKEFAKGSPLFIMVEPPE